MWGAIASAALQIGSKFIGTGSPKSSQAERDMFARTQELQGTADGLRSHENSRIRDLADLSDERALAVGKGVAGVQQAIGGPPQVLAHRPESKFTSNVLAQNRLRGKALVRVAQASDEAVEKTGFEDRMGYLSMGLNKARMALGQGANMIQAQANQRRATNAANQVIADEIGGAAVFGLGKYHDWRNSQPAGTD